MCSNGGVDDFVVEGFPRSSLDRSTDHSHTEDGTQKGLLSVAEQAYLVEMTRFGVQGVRCEACGSSGVGVTRESAVAVLLWDSRCCFGVSMFLLLDLGAHRMKHRFVASGDANAARAWTLVSVHSLCLGRTPLTCS